MERNEGGEEVGCQTNRQLQELFTERDWTEEEKVSK